MVHRFRVYLSTQQSQCHSLAGWPGRYQELPPRHVPGTIKRTGGTRRGRMFGETVSRWSGGSAAAPTRAPRVSNPERERRDAIPAVSGHDRLRITVTGVPHPLRRSPCTGIGTRGSPSIVTCTGRDRVPSLTLRVRRALSSHPRRSHPRRSHPRRSRPRRSHPRRSHPQYAIDRDLHRQGSHPVAHAQGSSPTVRSPTVPCRR
jgi:hypothetical protein